MRDYLGAPERIEPLHLLEPAADAAGRTSGYKSLKGAKWAQIWVYINQGNAATILLSPLQASAVAGTGSKAISATRIATKLDEAATSWTKQTEAATYTTDAGVKKKVIVFDIDPTKVLDIAGGFDCIGISTGASNAANITSALLVVYPRHEGASLENALAD